MALIGSDENKIQRAKTRVLLVLWAVADGIDNAVLKGKIKPLERTKEKPGDYDEVFAALAADGAITLTKYKSSYNVTLTQVGYGLLGDWLRSDFEFEGKQIGARMGNHLVKWITHVPHVSVANLSESAPKISSYDEFKVVALETYDSLKNDPEHGKLVPIYKIRRKIGDRISHDQFDEWLVEMHRNEDLYLHGGGKIDATQDQIIDSIYSDVVKTLYFIVERLTH
jgi:hypothetical protein